MSTREIQIKSAAVDFLLKKEAAAAEYLHNRRPVVYFREHTSALDQLMAVLWQEYFHGRRDMCLLATGGYGRGELYPFSDADIALVTAEEPDKETAAAIASFVQALWDMQVHPAPKTGTPAQLCAAARDDLTGDTAYLEARFICGNHLLARQFCDSLTLQRDVAAFIEGKLLEQQQRHAKAQGADSLLEANVKTAPGGLRDIHTMMWLAEVQGIDDHVSSLVRQKIITRTEGGLLLYSHRQLAKIRIDLHLCARRAEERLVFDLQERVAEAMGYTADATERASEKLMRVFYRAAKTVRQLGGILLPMLRGRVYSRLPRMTVGIDDDYYQVGNMLAVYDRQLFRRDPLQLFKALEVAQRRNNVSGFAPKTLRAWWEAAQNTGTDLYACEENRRRFVGFFRHGDGLTHLLRFMNLYGVLGRYLPGWSKIVGLLQHDLFHIYPVDDHILTVVRNMRRLAMDAHSHEMPFASSLMHGFTRKHILYLAALFHDIAKGRGGDHAVLGVADARRFAADHFLEAEESELLAWLVEEHLLMSQTAQKEDIQDPEVVARFAGSVQTHERLCALYLLTVADIRGTNPKIWNSWRASLLEGLFHATEHYLEAGGTDRRSLARSRKEEALAVLDAASVGEERRKALWQRLGETYFFRYGAEDIAWHLPEIAAEPDKTAIRMRLLPEGQTFEVMVYMPNADKIFAGISRIFSRHGLGILTARAYITAHDYVLDTFVLQMPPGALNTDYPRISVRLQSALETFSVQDGRAGPSVPMRKRGRRSRHLPIAPRITVMPEEEAGWYVLEVITADRPYLLADMADVLFDAGASIRYAKISTLDERAEDSFLIYASALASPQAQLTLEKSLFEQLNG